MIAIEINLLRLRAQLLLRRLGAPACLAVALLALGAAAWVWAWQQRAMAAQLEARPLPQPSLAVATAAAAAPATASENMARFYAALGQQRHAEQQVKQLFDLAAKNGLVLAQGEYKSGYDKASRVTTWQVTLPLKGSYTAVWQFALQALRAMPFASLDELSFRREQIADTQLEARLRLTFYLADTLSDSVGDAP
ncbi:MULTISPECIES: hypothetical protein [unclassified Janthinobacterium]|uniref:hypothetical protein n=1 Tax=unclassified Janthinobacterium TaxID=2610881 RepID=UPI0018CBE76B|nr:hypothetical protein [Janthinobacterium sp. CG_23.4]MDH6156936.1 hypothetical protein [Janthinobacterium sp. CG_23.4]